MSTQLHLLEAELTVAEEAASREASQREVNIPDPDAETASEIVRANTKEICNATAAGND